MSLTREIYTGCRVIESLVGNRPLYLVLLVGERVLLIDSGCPHDPADSVYPAVAETGARAIDFVVNTHSDLDHCGGNHAIKRLFPNAILACGVEDRELIEAPDLHLRNRYDAYRADHGIGYDASTTAWLRESLGEPQLVDLTFGGNEGIRLSSEWRVEVVKLPGHSPGHIGILDRENRALFMGDAIHGNGYDDVNGVPVLCPTYIDVETYLNTIQFIETLELNLLVGCHWPVFSETGIRDFCRASREFVTKAGSLVEEKVRQSGPEGVTLRRLCLELGPRLGSWPREVDIELAYALHGHLKQLIKQKAIKMVPGSDPQAFSCR